MSKKQNLTRSLAITDEAYDMLVRMNQLTGLSLGALGTMAIERAFDPKRNPEMAEVIATTRQRVVDAIN